MATVAINVGAIVNKVAGPKLQKLQNQLNGALALANALQDIAVQIQNFDPQLNKNFPKRDEQIAQFDQELTCSVSEYRTHMLETRNKIPKPKPPVTPVVAVWPGILGGSAGA